MAYTSLGPLDPMPPLQVHSLQWQQWGPAVLDLSGDDWRNRLALRFPKRHAAMIEAMTPVAGINLTFAASRMGAGGRGRATTRWLLTMEQRTKGKLLRILAHACAGGAHFLDIGSNIGFYGMMAASLGCKVHFFDAQCACTTAVADGLLANDLQRRAWVHPVGVSDQPREFPAEEGYCNGRYPQSSPLPFKSHITLSHCGTSRAMPLVELLPMEKLENAQTIAKVDVEGNELSVLRGLLPYLERRLIAHLFIEVTTGYGFYAKLGVSRHDVAKTFVRVMGFGYALTEIRSNTTHSISTISRFFDVSNTQVDFHLTRI